MPLSSPPTAVAPLDAGFLNAGITASDTSITVAPINKYSGDTKTKQGFSSTTGIGFIQEGDKIERFSFTGSSVDSTTKVTTLTGCTRGLSLTSTSASFSSGTGATFNKGARIYLVHDITYIQSAVFTNVSNTFTAAQTFNAAVSVASTLTVTGSSSYILFPNLTQTQRLALTPSNGMVVYDTTNGALYQYIGGSWSTFATGSVVNAADGTAGKVDLATAAEVAAGTATDASSGASNVIPVSIVKTSSTGAVNGTVPALNSAVALDVSIGGTGRTSVTSGGLLVGAGTSQMTVIGPGSSGQVPVSNGTTIAMGTIPPTGSIFAWTTRTAPTSYLLCNGTAVSRSTYATLFSTIAPTIGTATITIASPAVISCTAHGLLQGDALYFTTTGALPTGLSPNTIYYVIAAGLTANAFEVSTSIDGAAVNTSGTQSGTHTIVSCPYGLGDGSTTFNVPDLRGRVPNGDDKMGTSAASRIVLSNPALGITGGVESASHTHSMTQNVTNPGGGGVVVGVGTTGSTSISLMSPYLTLFYIIKT